MTTQAYNGYANYPTWAVALWLDNDEYTCEMLDEMANQTGEFRQGPETVSEQADYLEQWVQENFMPDCFVEPSMAGDMLQWAMGQVDWREIIETHIEKD